MPWGGAHEACVQDYSVRCNCSDCCGRCCCVESAGTASLSWTAVKTADLSHIRSYAGTPGTWKISGEFHRLPVLSLAAGLEQAGRSDSCGNGSRRAATAVHRSAREGLRALSQG